MSYYYHFLVFFICSSLILINEKGYGQETILTYPQGARNFPTGATLSFNLQFFLQSGPDDIQYEIVYFLIGPNGFKKSLKQTVTRTSGFGPHVPPFHLDNIPSIKSGAYLFGVTIHPQDSPTLLNQDVGGFMENTSFQINLVDGTSIKIIPQHCIGSTVLNGVTNQFVVITSMVYLDYNILSF